MNRRSGSSSASISLHAFFEVVVTREDVTHPKPDPEPYRMTARRLDVAPARCLVIEDSINGVLSARRAGCAVIGLATSFSAERLLEAGAGFVADDYAALAHHLVCAC